MNNCQDIKGRIFYTEPVEVKEFMAEIVTTIPLICLDCKTDFKIGTHFKINNRVSEFQCPNCGIWTKIGYFN